jgi:hypothetical protein
MDADYVEIEKNGDISQRIEERQRGKKKKAKETYGQELRRKKLQREDDRLELAEAYPEVPL